MIEFSIKKYFSLFIIINSFPLLLWKRQFQTWSGAIQFSRSEIIFSRYYIKIYVLMFHFIMYKAGISVLEHTKAR